MTSKTETQVSRRRFIKGSAVAAGVAATGTVAMPNVSRAETVTLKMQSSWGASDVFQEMAKQYTDRCEKMAGGRLKFDLLPAGAVVKAFGADGVTVQQFNEPAGGQVVFHLHVHVIPRFEGVSLRPHTGAMADQDVLAGHAEKIRATLAES